jgi:hemerythrin-like domain-containing protein
MSTIVEFMTKEHGKCDQYFAKAEQSVDRMKWEDAESELRAYLEAMTRHFHIEEEILFRKFEQVNGAGMGPTRVMRMEHDQMRKLFDSMSDLLANKDKDGFLGSSETLLILMQQHNMKEEQMLYPMIDRIVAPEIDQVLAELAEL